MPRGISSNAGEVLKRMQRRPAAIRKELTAAARSFAPQFERETKRLLVDKVYSVPIPLKASADRATDLTNVPPQLRAQVLKRRQFERPLPEKSKVRGKTSKGQYGQWQRTGALLRAEKGRADGMKIILSNGQEYAVARHNLGTDKGRKIVSPGVLSVQWHAEAVRNLGPALREARHEAVLRGLRRP